jgi:hypothetical protein
LLSSQVTTGRLILERHDDIGYARHGLETRLYGARAKGAGQVLNRERYRLFGGESGSRKDEAKTTGSHGKQFDQWVSFQGLKR